jgi:uncharacterized Ntn-hydrolase superfamily protein
MARSSTYSIVVSDLDRREWGVAMQSRFLAIGAVAACVEADVGAVATQSFMKTEYGRTGLRLICEGLFAHDALARVLASESEKRYGGLEAEVRAALERIGYATGDLTADLDTWAGIENLEERIDGAARIDPIVLDELRRLAARSGATTPDPEEERDG